LIPPIRRLLVATTNSGKWREIAGILDGIPVELVTLRDFTTIEEPEETGTTFQENARLKARYYSNATGLVSVADDSGIEIDALDGAPGVHSARWHGTDYPAKFRKIQELFRERGVSGSTARFVCTITVANGESILYEARGTVEGEIAAEPRGSNGFGYDPIFFYPPLGCTLAELDRATKATVSHRGKAFRALREYLLNPGSAVRDPGSA
jgi:non-canonical purine NTP pyrophosphatase (RdgB/HAM1 family)